jgi:hypothetical protein
MNYIRKYNNKFFEIIKIHKLNFYENYFIQSVKIKNYIGQHKQSLVEF